MENVNVESFGYWSFLSSVDWREPWLIILISAHLLTTVSIFTVTKSHTNVQIFIFFILLAGAYFSESINELAAENWRLFSKQQYFDSSGLFISAVFSIPILLNCMLLIGLWLYNSTQLITKIKIEQQKQKLRREEAQKRYKTE